MSTPNFAVQGIFPLYVLDFTSEVSYCPICSLYQDVENDVCENCGGELEHRTFYDEVEASYTCSEIESKLESVNENFMFHEIKLLGGRYWGVQFYVEEKHDPNEYDNDECRYQFDMCRSAAIRRYESEINKVKKSLHTLAQEYGFDQMFCCAIFSNGEALYGRVDDTPRSRIRQTVSPLY